MAEEPTKDTEKTEEPTKEERKAVEAVEEGTRKGGLPTAVIIAGVVVVACAACVIGLSLAGVLAGLLALPTSRDVVPALPDIGAMPSGVDVEHKTFSTEIGGADSAQVTLDLSLESTYVTALDDQFTLIDAELDTVGDIDFDVSGTDEKVVRLREYNLPPGQAGNLAEDLRWDIGLSPEAPIDLTVVGGSGPVSLALDGLTLSELALDGGSGPVQGDLPGGIYDITLDVGSGPFDLAVANGLAGTIDMNGGSGPLAFTLAAGSDATVAAFLGSGPFTLRLEDDTAVSLSLDTASGPVTVIVGDDSDTDISLDAGSGPVMIDAPDDAAVRVEVADSGSGPIDLAARLDLVDTGGDDDAKTGVWESVDFEDASHQITVTAESLGSGPLTVE